MSPVQWPQTHKIHLHVASHIHIFMFVRIKVTGRDANILKAHTALPSHPSNCSGALA